MKFTKGPELYNKAKKLIPGGTQLLSKRPEMFLPEQWPAYYSRAKGVEVWDLDGNRLVEIAISGVGACTLGYADSDVDAAVKKAVDSGTMSTLNCPEEIELAELLCELHPWAEMVRFGRSGGEAMAIAARISRAATGRDMIAFCGYHGWHDWYISANLSDDRALDGQLLPGLAPTGVPRGLKDTMLPFNYNKIEELENIVNKHGGKLAAIVMEPVRSVDPAPGFLERVRELATKAGAVLVFDEVTSGWRMNLGGIHLLHKVQPDMAVFAKGMSNGYPMAAVIGRREVMEAAQKSFISSTFWTEKIGPTAALATIRKMKKENVQKHLCQVAERLRSGWKRIFEIHDLNMKIMGIPPLSVLSFCYEGEGVPEALGTLYVQEMLYKGYLASKSCYLNFSHTDKVIDEYLIHAEDTFKTIAKAIREDKIFEMLKGPVANTGFKRLT